MLGCQRAGKDIDQATNLHLILLLKDYSPLLLSMSGTLAQFPLLSKAPSFSGRALPSYAVGARRIDSRRKDRH